MKSEGPGLSSISSSRRKKRGENDRVDGVNVDQKTAGM